MQQKENWVTKQREFGKKHSSFRQRIKLFPKGEPATRPEEKKKKTKAIGHSNPCRGSITYTQGDRVWTGKRKSKKGKKGEEKGSPRGRK